jgi:tRNA pseudouridine13 synthase
VYKIKQLLEDFVVKEISSLKPLGSGDYTYFILKKKNYTTVRAIQHIADKLHLPVKFFGFAGNKDKNAVTEQIVSVKGIDEKKLEKINLKDIETVYVGKGDKPLSLGDLEGNKFKITVRNIDKQPKKISKIPNYFGEQRFSKNNAEIGKSIIKGDFKGAVALILNNEGDYEKDIKRYLRKSPNDFIGALRIIPKKILRMYVHSYQSYLWNRTVGRYLISNSNSKNIKIPLIGFGTELEDNYVGTIIKDILREEGIDLRDFVVRSIPESSSEGSTRNLFVTIQDFTVGNLEDDELNKGKKKVTIQFRLPKGSYATVALRYLFQ